MTPIRILSAESIRQAEQAEAARKAEAKAERARQAARPAELKNLSRVDSGKMHGWSVRFQRNGEKRGRFFYDSAHGGPDESLEAAQAWRDEQRRALGPVDVSDASAMHTHEVRQKNRESVSQTGVTGISVKRRAFDRTTIPYVTAYWLDAEGKRRQTSFSTARHGIGGAVRLAARARAQTSEWHGARPMSEDQIYDAALDAVRALAN